MIVFVPNSLIDLALFGIDIPLLESRYLQTLKTLEAHPVLGPKKHEWLWQKELLPVTIEQLARVHTKEYLDVVLSDNPYDAIAKTYEFDEAQGAQRFSRRPGLKPLSLLAETFRIQAQGTIQTLKFALEHRWSYFLGGGFHHAMTFAGRGFCLVNDILIAIRELQSRKLIKNVWIIDVDAHRGDGTAQIAYGDSSIATFSIHMASGWPLVESPTDNQGRLKPWFLPSTIDIGVERGEEARYSEFLQRGLNQLKSSFNGTKPDLAIVVQGSDPYEHDVLPSATLLRLSEKQMLERDRMVYEFLKAQDIPQAYVMAGGYGPENYKVHANFLTSLLLD